MQHHQYFQKPQSRNTGLNEFRSLPTLKLDTDLQKAVDMFVRAKEQEGRWASRREEVQKEIGELEKKEADLRGQLVKAYQKGGSAKNIEAELGKIGERIRQFKRELSNSKYADPHEIWFRLVNWASHSLENTGRLYDALKERNQLELAEKTIDNFGSVFGSAFYLRGFSDQIKKLQQNSEFLAELFFFVTDKDIKRIDRGRDYIFGNDIESHFGQLEQYLRIIVETGRFEELKAVAERLARHEYDNSTQNKVRDRLVLHSIEELRKAGLDDLAQELEKSAAQAGIRTAPSPEDGLHPTVARLVEYIKQDNFAGASNIIDELAEQIPGSLVGILLGLLKWEEESASARTIDWRMQALVGRIFRYSIEKELLGEQNQRMLIIAWNAKHENEPIDW